MESSIYSDGFCGVGRPRPNYQRLISVSDSEEEKPQLVIHHQAPSALCRESSSLCELHQHCPEALFQATIVKVNPATGKPVAWAQTYHRSLNSHFVAPHKNLQRRPKTMDFRMNDLLNQLEGSLAEEHIEFTPEDDPKMMPLKDDLIKAWEKLHEKEQEVEEMAMQWRTNTLEFLKGVMLKELEASRAEERCLVLYRRPGDVQKLDEEGKELEVEEPKVEEQVTSRLPHASDFLIDVMMTQMEAWRMEENSRSKKEKKMSVVEELSEEGPKLEEEGEKLGVEEQKLEERTPQRQLNELHFQAARTKEYCAIVSRRPKNAMRMSMEEELTENVLEKLEEEGEKLEVEEEKAKEKVDEKMGKKPKKKQAEVVKVPKVISHKQSFDKATSMKTIGTQTDPYPIVQDKATSMSSMCQLPEKISPENVPLHSTPAPGGQRIKKEVNCMATQYGLSVGQLAKKVQILKVKELVAGEPIPKPEPPELSTSLPWIPTTDSDQGENRVGDSLSSGEPLSPTPPSHNGSDYTRKPGEHLKKLYPSQVKQVSAKKKLNINIQDSQDLELRTEATLAAALAHSHKEFERLAREARKDPNKSIPKPKRHHSAGDSAK